MGKKGSKVTEMFKDGKEHKGGCKDHAYRPILLKPDVGRQFIESKDLIGPKSGFIQDDYGAHSIDNLNTTDIVFSIHVYYPPYPEAWAFHKNPKNKEQKTCKARKGITGGHSNCKESYFKTCTPTSMKLYLKKAFEYEKGNPKDNVRPEWYKQLCNGVAAALNPTMKEECDKKWDELLKYPQFDQLTDPTINAI